jgi:N-acetylmuramoyl-L-alanine amidase
VKIWIDAGHGQDNKILGKHDPGAVGNGTTEADTTLLLALSGRWILNKEFGIQTWLTRDDDTDSSYVGDRAAHAMAAGCTVGLALHMNASEKPSVTGTEAFYRDSQDAAWAKPALQAALSAFELRNRGIKSESQSQHPYLAVMDFKPPMCLLEFGYISNKTDLARVLDRDRRVAFWRNIGNILKAQLQA